MAVIGNWKLVVLERYAKFDGRAGREEFWFYVLANIAVYLVLLILAQVSNIFFVLYFLILVRRRSSRASPSESDASTTPTSPDGSC